MVISKNRVSEITKKKIDFFFQVLIDKMGDKMDQINERLITETKRIRFIDRKSTTWGYNHLNNKKILSIINPNFNSVTRNVVHYNLALGCNRPCSRNLKETTFLCLLLFFYFFSIKNYFYVKNFIFFTYYHLKLFK